MPTVRTGSIDPNSMSTSPWANAQRGGAGLSRPTYPDMGGMKFMLIIPNDFYRKKLMSLGSGYVATTLQRCNVRSGPQKLDSPISASPGLCRHPDGALVIHTVRRSPVKRLVTPFAVVEGKIPA